MKTALPQRVNPATYPAPLRLLAAAQTAACTLILSLLVLIATTPAQAKEHPESFADLADALLPAVVNISTTQSLEGRPGIEMPNFPPGSPFEEFFKEFFERNQPHPQQRRATSLGSGFIVDPSGYVVTNNHVIQDADEITVILHDDTRLPAKLIGRDPKTDVAVLKVDSPITLPAVAFGDSDNLRVGDWVVAIGNPFGFGGTVTAGIISARNRDINSGPYDDFLQTDASINRGNSGGPMFNLDGQVIGVNTAIYSPSGGSIGIGFAIPSNIVRPIVRQLIDTGEVKRGWIGVRIQEVTPEIADTLGLEKPKGALVASVIDDGPAAAADIRAGDVIVEFSGRAVDEMRSLPRIVADTDVGQTVPVKVWRDGKEQTLDVKVAALDEGEAKMAEAEGSGDQRETESEKIESLGFSVSSIDDAARERYDIAAGTNGVVVTAVDAAGAAAEKGLRVGDVIVELSQEEVTKPDDISSKIKAAQSAGRKTVLLLVEGQGGMRFIALRIDNAK
ncbi:MAG: DegQ family serine endoprotease [Rhodospirillales bacterium]|nr:DegQ family serine endoprotease [Rhodospirillales bacterium]